MATATKTKKGTEHKAAAKSGNGASTLEYLQHAIEDIDHARQHAVTEVRSALDAALDRLSSAAGDLRTRAEGEASELRQRADDQTADWQKSLEGATEDMRRDLARRAVRAQQTPEALTELSTEIRRRREQLKREHAA